jgi:hypothetical protein
MLSIAAYTVLLYQTNVLDSNRLIKYQYQAGMKILEKIQYQYQAGMNTSIQYQYQLVRSKGHTCPTLVES